MPLVDRFHYFHRIFTAYLIPGSSHLTFWHETPKENFRAPVNELGEYPMQFSEKADYAAHLDSAGIPMLDYHGKIGLQYNPIAIAQWGLGNYNLFRESGDASRKQKFLAASDWLCANLAQNSAGVWVWSHLFDWEYRTQLKAPWYSGLAQGQAISLLLRAHQETGGAIYKDASRMAFFSFIKTIDEGGVVFTDERQNIWFEEYIVSPPTHILNGFIWAAWGIRDYFIATKDPAAGSLFAQAIETLKANLDRYDAGFWSLYELSGTRLRMLASPFYHQLHIVQLRVTHRLTGEKLFADYADRWQGYAKHRSNRLRALCYKGVFKLLYY